MLIVIVFLLVRCSNGGLECSNKDLFPIDPAIQNFFAPRMRTKAESYINSCPPLLRLCGRVCVLGLRVVTISPGDNTCSSWWYRPFWCIRHTPQLVCWEDAATKTGRYPESTGGEVRAPSAWRYGLKKLWKTFLALAWHCGRLRESIQKTHELVRKLRIPSSVLKSW